MGLLSIIKKIKQKEREIRILLVYALGLLRALLSLQRSVRPRAAGLECRGLDNAGKTTIVKRLEGEDIHTVSPTLGFSIRTLQYKRQDPAWALAACHS